MERELFKASSNPDQQNAECFACVICTHGTESGVYGVDGEVLSLEQITAFFDSSNCAALQNKPKLFFIQACQGGKKIFLFLRLSKP